jgi:hypothetical protein
MNHRYPRDSRDNSMKNVVCDQMMIQYYKAAPLRPLRLLCALCVPFFRRRKERKEGAKIAKRISVNGSSNAKFYRNGFVSFGL